MAAQWTKLMSSHLLRPQLCPFLTGLRHRGEEGPERALCAVREHAEASPTHPLPTGGYTDGMWTEKENEGRALFPQQHLPLKDRLGKGMDHLQGSSLRRRRVRGEVVRLQARTEFRPSCKGHLLDNRQQQKLQHPILDRFHFSTTRPVI